MTSSQDPPQLPLSKRIAQVIGVGIACIAILWIGINMVNNSLTTDQRELGYAQDLTAMGVENVQSVDDDTFTGDVGFCQFVIEVKLKPTRAIFYLDDGDEERSFLELPSDAPRLDTSIVLLDLAPFEKSCT